MDESNQNQQQPAEQSITGSDGDGRLDTVKKRALEALAPLINDLDVNPERKFDICISAMRLTDNKELAEVALEAALAISAKGTQAEALVELLTEVNYLQKS